MVREAKKEEMGMVYREFSRQKYNKYKLQFPKMRQSEIITKIIKEWEALNDEAKLTLKRTFQQNKFLSTDDISNSETKRTDSKQAKAKAAEEATEPKPTEIHAG